MDEDRKPYDKEQFFRNWIIKEPIKKPGKEFEYNNSNYNLLAWIIEYVSGQTYNEFLQENIFLKIGMNHTMFDKTGIFYRNTPTRFICQKTKTTIAMS